MKKQLLKKLYAFIVTAMIFSASAHAQIVYTDVIPDSTMNCIVNLTPCSENYNLDLNNDSNTDFILTAFYHYSAKKGVETYSNVTASPLNGNTVKDTLVNSTYASILLQFNTVIDSNLLLQQSWQTSGSQSLKNVVDGKGGGGDTIWGLWDNLSDHYLGLRLLQSGQTYYGWVRLRIDVTQSYASVIIRDYAYNSIPDQPILAGQTITTGITKNSFASSINLFPNPATNHLTIDLGSNHKRVQVTIADLTGKVMYTTMAKNTQKVEMNTNDFAEGNYIVQIQAAEFIGMKKLIINK